jgi:molybdenum cofactor cytidylyltransferase
MITAIILAAGLSTRMGKPKPLLPWGSQTVIEHILTILLDCPVDTIIVVAGHQHDAVERRLAGRPVTVVYNADYAAGEMLSSLQAGLRSAPPPTEAALIVLGDQPALERSVVERLVAAFRGGQGRIIVPSYQMRRGHPLLIDRRYWTDILALGTGQTLRDFMQSAREAIYHVNVTVPDVLQDMDTPDDYRRALEGYLRARASLGSLSQEV